MPLGCPAGLPQLLIDLSQFVGPVFLNRLLNVVADKSAPAWEGYMYAGKYQGLGTHWRTLLLPSCHASDNSVFRFIDALPVGRHHVCWNADRFCC